MLSEHQIIEWWRQLKNDTRNKTACLSLPYKFGSILGFSAYVTRTSDANLRRQSILSFVSPLKLHVYEPAQFLCCIPNVIIHQGPMYTPTSHHPLCGTVCEEVKQVFILKIISKYCRYSLKGRTVNPLHWKGWLMCSAQRDQAMLGAWSALTDCCLQTSYVGGDDCMHGVSQLSPVHYAADISHTTCDCRSCSSHLQFFW